MKQVLYTRHLELRLRLRGIDTVLPKDIYATARRRYVDTVTAHFVAIKRVPLAGRSRDVALIYEEQDTVVWLVTIHPLKRRQLSSRILSGRWRKL